MDSTSSAISTKPKLEPLHCLVVGLPSGQGVQIKRARMGGRMQAQARVRGSRALFTNSIEIGGRYGRYGQLDRFRQARGCRGWLVHTCVLVRFYFVSGIYMKQSSKSPARGFPRSDSMATLRWDVEPLDGWHPVAPCGLLRHGPGDECRLVRLVDVAAWLGHEYGRADVLRLLLAPLCQNDGHPWGCQVFVVNGTGYALRLLDRAGPALETVDFWQFLRMPYASDPWDCISRESTPGDVMDTIAETWRYAWPGLADPGKDLGGYMRRVVEANSIRNERIKAGHADDFAPVSADMCSPDRVEAMALLERLAVPVPVAFALWGWGRAVEVVAQTDAQEAPSATVAPLMAEDVKTFPDLVQYRQRLAGGQKLKTAPPWPAHHVALFAERLQQECEQGRERGAVERIAVELLATRQALAGVLKRHGYSPTTGQALPKRLQRANAMGDMADRLKTGTTGR